jgi:hypothetical protein
MCFSLFLCSLCTLILIVSYLTKISRNTFNIIIKTKTKTECTYNHFNTNANCPNCGRILGENDFTEVTVSDPDSKISNDPNGIVQSLLTKTSKQPGATIAWNDVFAALLREHHTLERNYRFFVNVSFAYIYIYISCITVLLNFRYSIISCPVLIVLFYSILCLFIFFLFFLKTFSSNLYERLIDIARKVIIA